jgi:adenylate cyclase
MSQQPHEDIIVVGIDEESLQGIADDWPWSRDIYVPFLENMNQPGYEAKAIAFDILFVTETDRDPEIDQYFAEALSQYDNVILPSYTLTDNSLTRRTLVKKDELVMTQQLIKPIPVLDEVSHDAHINAIIDKDGVIRRTWLRLNTHEGEIPSMAYKAVELAGVDVEHYLDLHPQTEISIDFQATSYDFETVSFLSVLTGDFPPENFKDRIVLIGYTAVGVGDKDTGAVPVENEMKLVYVHANIINQLLNSQYILFVSDWITLFMMILMIFLTIWFTWRLKTIMSVILLFVSTFVLLGGQYTIFKAIGIYILTSYAIAVLFITYLVNIAIKSYLENKQKNFITKQFGRYISPDLVKEIAATDQELKLGGINKELSILFLDIRGFTTFGP